MQKRIKINDHVTVGGQPTVEEIKQLAQEGFHSVVNLRVQDEDDEQIPPHEEAVFVRDEEMEYVHVPITSKQILHEQVQTFRQALASLKPPIFVHCGSAKRAGAMAMMEEGIRQGWSGQETLEKAQALGIDTDIPGLKTFVKDFVDKEHQKESVRSS